MLDQDSVLEPRLTGKSAAAEGSVRHLSHDELEAYANGRLASARVGHCSTHLDSCEACRAELEDIRTLQTELSAFSRVETNRREPGRRARRRGLAVPLAASGAVVLVAAVGTFFWMRHERLHRHAAAGPATVALSAVPPDMTVARSSGMAAGHIERASAMAPAPIEHSAVPTAAPAARSVVSPVTTVAGHTAPSAAPSERASSPATPSVGRSKAVPGPSVARSPALTVASVQRSPTPGTAPLAPAVPATGTIQTRDALLAEQIAALPEDFRLPVSDAIQHGRVQLPSDVRRLHDQAPGLAGPQGTNIGFSLSGPFGEATSDTRPKFTWQPLQGAIGYTVEIVDQGLRPVQHSRGLRATSWRPRRPLARGRTYLWQVTATMHGGSKVVATSPSPSEALLRVIPRKLADEMTRFQRGHREAHLVLGVLYAQAGMVTEGANELREIPQGDSSYDLARRLLGSLSSGSPKSAATASR
jgi:hypothetical protein